tara:strand:+ start:50 stop:265 length:216 start_codon:yes stop_codon:yes gene_type:complete
MKFTNALVEKLIDTMDLKVEGYTIEAVNGITMQFKYLERFNKLLLLKKYWKIRPSYYAVTIKGLLQRMVIL